MLQNRDDLRQTYFDVWQKMQDGQVLEPMEKIIAEVIKLHPEYHSLLGSPQQAIQQEFSPESGQTNPFLHMGFHIGVREQVINNLPEGIENIHSKLCRRKQQHEAEHQMIDCLAQTLWLSQHDNVTPDMSLYLECLKKL